MEESCDLQVHESCKKEKYSLYNSLVCVAHGVIGLYTTVDLRNDSYISGKVDHIDGFMNITFSDAVYTDIRGNEYYYNFFFVKERNVRYIHIPSQVNIKDTLLIKKMRRRREPVKPKVMTLKRKNLLLRQQETLERVRKIKEERLKKKMEKEKSDT